jgi:hypothetical protein
LSTRGGNFTQVGGHIRNNIAALDLTNGNATAWDPNADGQVSALAVAGNRVYAGGLFTTIAAEGRQNLRRSTPRPGSRRRGPPMPTTRYSRSTPHAGDLRGRQLLTLGGAGRELRRRGERRDPARSRHVESRRHRHRARARRDL